MSIDELIEKLQKVKEEKGNIEVVIWMEGQWSNINDIDMYYNMVRLCDE